MSLRNMQSSGSGQDQVAQTLSSSSQKVSGKSLLSRRDFLGLIGAATTSMMAVGSAWADFELPATEWERWKKALHDTGARRSYSSDRHTDARLHLGGIGTGNFELGADGQLTSWQLCNNLREGLVPFYFAIKAGKTAKLLQTAGGPEWPRVNKIAMTGEYPMAILQFQDDELPVGVELTAFSPFSPLDVELSSMPVGVFKFRLRNLSDSAQEVSLAAMLTNPVGYCSIGRIDGILHPGLGCNVNESFREGSGAGFFMTAVAGREPFLDQAVTIYVLKDLFALPPDPRSGDKNYAAVDPRNLAIPPLDRPANLTVKVVDSIPSNPGSGQTVVWLEDATREVPVQFLRSARDAVQTGATLVFSGRSLPLINSLADVTKGKPFSEMSVRPDVLFEDFESGYGKWKVEGSAFGVTPAHGTLANQNPVTGFIGKGLVNSFVGGDDTTGKMTSEAFVIDRHFIRFLVGGGHFRETQIRLVIDDRVERTAAGNDNERLDMALWDVREFARRTARIEIVDNQKGGWGHINVDQIVFSDVPGDPELLHLVDELLPVRCAGMKDGQLEGLVLRDDTIQSTAPNGEALFTRAYGKGKVVLVAGQLLDSAHTDSSRVRQKTYSILCGLAGADYTMTEGQSSRSPGFGSLALSVLEGEVSGLAGFEDWNEAWKQFETTGKLKSIESQSAGPTREGRTLHCALATSVSIPPKGQIEVPFLLSWHYPNRYNADGTQIGAFYATQWPEARAIMNSAIARYPALAEETESFRRTFYESRLPYWLLDAMTANAAISRHIGVVFRIANGDVYGWEGSNGSCPPTCTHVWGYEQSFARLFPALEKEMRRIDFIHQQEPDGGIHNRTDVPSPPHPSGERPFTDGHCSCILKAYREALNSPDDAFLREYWPHVKRAVEYLIRRDQMSSGGEPKGVLSDDQWNTYDEALHGVTTFISGYYLAALRAGEEWARRMDDRETAERFHAVFQNGQSRLVELCWNGEYFQQHLADYNRRPGEVGPGCMSDQLIGQWWAHQLDLGYILPKEMVKTALSSIYRYNFKSDLTGWKHSPRAFAGDGDKGLIICTWPKGGRPANVMLYSDEVWTGIEYQVAAHMIYEGLVEEAFAIAKGARDRYDGVPRLPISRNPWCEIECGGHYTRAMSSWSLLLALSGFLYDGTLRSLRFTPTYKPDDFKSFFSAPEGWGSLTQVVKGGVQKVEIEVVSGKLPLKSVELTVLQLGKRNPKALLAGKNIPTQPINNGKRCQIGFPEGGITIHEREKLEVEL